jgi:hypothetical protein
MATKSGLLAALCMTAMLAATPLVANGPGPIQPVLVSGDWAPGLNADESIQGFRAADQDENLYLFRASLSNDGQVAVGARLQGAGVNSFNNTGIFLGRPGSLALVARKGDHVPGQPENITFAGDGYEDTGIYWGRSSDGGRITVGLPIWQDYSVFVGGGIWTGQPGSLSLVAWDGMPAGDAAGSTITRVSLLTANRAGHIAFWADQSAEREISSLWLVSPEGQRSLIAKTGQEAAAAGPGFAFDVFRGLSMNAAGQVAFNASLLGSSPEEYVPDSVWVGRPGKLALAVREGDDAPGAPAGFRFGAADPYSLGFTAFCLDGQDEVAFSAVITDGTDREGVFRGTPGHLALLALAGNQAAGAPQGTTWSRVGMREAHGAGRITFWGILQGPGVTANNNDGIWLSGPQGTLLLAREGQPAPGTPRGTRFGGPRGEPCFFLPKLNARGFGVVEAEVLAPGQQDGSGQGIWSFDPAGRLTLLAHTGQLMRASQGDHRTVTSLVIMDLNDL